MVNVNPSLFAPSTRARSSEADRQVRGSKQTLVVSVSINVVLMAMYQSNLYGQRINVSLPSHRLTRTGGLVVNHSGIISVSLRHHSMTNC